MIEQTYAELQQRFERLSIVGDSAGGGLALGFAQELVARGVSLPARLILLSPWLDLTLANPALQELERIDPWLRRATLRVAAEAWAGGDDATQPRLSPVNGALRGLPPLTSYVGTRDLPFADTKALHERALAAGVDSTLNLERGAIHVYPILPTREGRRAAAEILRLVSA